MDLINKVSAVMKLNCDTVLITVASSHISAQAKPGQFVNIKSGCPDAYLRRPISICSVDRIKGTVDLGIQARGEGTKSLCLLEEGDPIDMMGPLGKGFSLKPEDGRIAVVGGGIGIFPLLQLLKEHPAKHKTALLGYRNRDSVILEYEFRAASDNLSLATDDGSYGAKGFVTALLEDVIKKDKPDRVFICGPTPMMKRCVEICRTAGAASEVSMEQRLGCGIGACLVCACKTGEGDNWNYSHVCKDGPVFDGASVIFD